MTAGLQLGLTSATRVAPITRALQSPASATMPPRIAGGTGGARIVFGHVGHRVRQPLLPFNEAAKTY